MTQDGQLSRVWRLYARWSLSFWDQFSVLPTRIPNLTWFVLVSVIPVASLLRSVRTSAHVHAERPVLHGSSQGPSAPCSQLSSTSISDCRAPFVDATTPLQCSAFCTRTMLCLCSKIKKARLNQLLFFHSSIKLFKEFIRGWSVQKSLIIISND